MKYRKKLAVVEAFQMTKENTQVGSDTVPVRYANYPEWLKAACNIDYNMPNALYWNSLAGALRLTKIEGVLPVADNDWIILDAAGDLQLVKPNIFDKLYEPVDATTQDTTDSLVDDINKLLAESAKETWDSPASLKPGLYVWAVYKYDSTSYELSTFDPVTSTMKTIATARGWSLVYGDAATPPNAGYWLVTEYGKAVKAWDYPSEVQN